MPLSRRLLTLTLTLALCALASHALAQTCPKAADVQAKDLYGNWLAHLSNPGGSPLAVRLHLTRNPEFADSLYGWSQHEGKTDTQRAVVAGDVENSDFNLEEADNGRDISALWAGRLVDNACGKEIVGTWKNTQTQQERRFVARLLRP